MHSLIRLIIGLISIQTKEREDEFRGEEKGKRKGRTWKQTKKNYKRGKGKGEMGRGISELITIQMLVQLVRG